MQFVKKISNDRLTLAPGTLYGAIKTLLEKDWIKLYNHDIAARKKVYVITDMGFQIIESEITRLKELYQNGLEITGGRQNDEKS